MVFPNCINEIPSCGSIIITDLFDIIGGFCPVPDISKLFCTDSTIYPLSEGLVTPPLGVEKLSPRLN